MNKKILTDEQIERFDRDGVIVLRGALDCSMLKMLDEGQVSLDFDNKDLFILEEEERHFLCRIMHFHKHSSLQALCMMGSDAVETIATQLCGKELVPSADMMIIKNRGCNARIPWHQDFIDNEKRNRIIAIGIYLDDSKANDGGVSFIRASHKKKQDICSIEHGHSEDIDCLSFDLNAGDIVIHDPMIVHSSGVMKIQKKRRTLYYEFRNEADVKKSWPQDFLHQRLQLMKLAKNISSNKIKKEPEIKIAQCYQAKLPVIPPNYCSCAVP